MTHKLRGKKNSRKSCSSALNTSSFDDLKIPSLNRKNRRQTISVQRMDICDEDIDEVDNQMKVFVRTRPLSSKELDRGDRKVVTSFCTDNIVRISKAGRTGAVLRSEMGAQYDYQFDTIFGSEATQEEVYAATTCEIVKDALSGINCTVFAYGATGAGKTHTMMGGTSEDSGIIPRALVDIFDGVSKKKDEYSALCRSELGQGKDFKSCEWSIKLSFLEVYNETIFDLLTEEQKPLQPCEDPADFRVKVLGLTEIAVHCVEQILELLRQGNSRRRMESTFANTVSSRSHAVMQVTIEKVEEVKLPPLMPGQRRLPHEQGRKISTTSTLSLIDLAGSERAAATQNRGSRLREGANINKSLLALANCINALSSKKSNSSNGNEGPQRVKYRDSKLTHLLKSSLEGNCRVCMIAAVNPSDRSYEESHNTLKYANRAKQIKLSASNNVREVDISTTSSPVDVARLENLVAENQELRQRLSLNAKKGDRNPLQAVLENCSPGALSNFSEMDTSLIRDSFGKYGTDSSENVAFFSPGTSISSMSKNADYAAEIQSLKKSKQILEEKNETLACIVEEQRTMLKQQTLLLQEQACLIKRHEDQIARAEKQTRDGEKENHAEKMGISTTEASRVLVNNTNHDLSVSSFEGKKRIRRRESFIPKPPFMSSKKRHSSEEIIVIDPGRKQHRTSQEPNVSPFARIARRIRNQR